MDGDERTAPQEGALTIERHALDDCAREILRRLDWDVTADNIEAVVGILVAHDLRRPTEPEVATPEPSPFCRWCGSTEEANGHQRSTDGQRHHDFEPEPVVPALTLASMSAALDRITLRNAEDAIRRLEGSLSRAAQDDWKRADLLKIRNVLAHYGDPRFPDRYMGRPLTGASFADIPIRTDPTMPRDALALEHDGRVVAAATFKAEPCANCGHPPHGPVCGARLCECSLNRYGSRIDDPGIKPKTRPAGW